MPEQALGGCPLGLGLVIEDRPLEFSCIVHVSLVVKLCNVLPVIRFMSLKLLVNSERDTSMPLRHSMLAELGLELRYIYSVHDTERMDVQKTNGQTTYMCLLDLRSIP